MVLVVGGVGPAFQFFFFNQIPLISLRSQGKSNLIEQQAQLLRSHSMNLQQTW